MPDYNKGDFTQQGIDGFVEGGLHLNEKRCLTAKISTDEDSAGLDSVEINIHDHLNDLDYTITGENLTVGENTIGGGSGIPFCTITFVNNGNNAVYPVDYASTNFGMGYFEYNENGYISNYISIPANSSGTYNMLYAEVSGDFAVVNFNSTVTTSNYVNCETEDGAIYVIDPSLPSSFTATVA